MRRALFSALVLLAVALIQIIGVNSLPLPGAAAPDLVLVTVAALAVTGGPLEGALAGFGAGLLLDVAPPAAHLVGQDALVFTLAGYGVGRLAALLEGTVWPRLAAVAAGAVAGEALTAGVGIMFSEPGITWVTVRQVLPAAVIYDCLISPFALAAVVALRERSGALAAGGSVMGGELAALRAAAAAPLAGLAGTTEAIRSTGTGRMPRLRSAGSWIGSHPPPGQARQAPSRAPRRLRLRGGQAGSAAAPPVSRSLPTRVPSLRLASRHRGERLPGAAVAVGALGDARAFLGGSVPRAGSFRGGPSALRRTRHGLLPGSRPRPGSFRGGVSAARPAAAARQRGSQPRKGAFGGGPSAARTPGAAFGSRAQPRKGAFGGGPSAARPAGAGLLRRRPRRGTFSGGPSAVRTSPVPLAGRRLRIGSRRSRDGVLGGSVASMLGRRSGVRLSPGRAAAPRFRGGGALTGRAGRRGGHGGGGLTGRLPGTRLAGTRLSGRAPRLGRSRSRVWRIGSKRTGGL